MTRTINSNQTIFISMQTETKDRQLQSQQISGFHSSQHNVSDASVVGSSNSQNPMDSQLPQKSQKNSSQEINLIPKNTDNQVEASSNIFESKDDPQMNEMSQNKLIKKEQSEVSQFDEQSHKLVENKQAVYEPDQYYEVGDLVIVKWNGLLKIGTVIKTMKNYSKYKVRYIGLDITRVYSLDQLQDYNEEGIASLRKQLQFKSPQELEKLNKVMAMAEAHQRRQQMKEERELYKQRYRKHRAIERELCSLRLEEMHQELKEDKSKKTREKSQTLKAKAKYQIQKLFLEKSAQSIKQAEMNHKVNNNPFSVGEQEKQGERVIVMEQPKVQNDMLNPKIQTQTISEVEPIIENQELQPTSRQQDVEIKPPEPMEEQQPLIKEWPKQKTNIVLKYPLISHSSKPSAFAAYTQPIINQIHQSLPRSGPKIKYQSQSQKLMDNYFQQYECASHSLSQTLQKLKNQSQSVLVRIMQQIIQKLDRWVTQGCGQYEQSQTFKRYGQDCDIMATIHQHKLIDIHRLSQSKIILKAAVCAWHCSEFYDQISCKVNLKAQYQLIKDMVEFWHVNYEQESRRSGVEQRCRMVNMQKLDRFWKLIRK